MATDDLQIPAYDREGAIVSLYAEAPAADDLAYPAYDRTGQLVALKLDVVVTDELAIHQFDRQAAITAAFSGPFPITPWYVVPGGAGAKDGLSWATAFEYVDDGVEAANGDALKKEVWVKAGTYRRKGVTNFVTRMRKGVKLYGGFDGTEIRADQRDPATNVTILNGQFGEAASVDHVVYASGGTSGTTIIDGFTITRGVANGGGGDDNGAGIYSVIAMTVTRCIVYDNHANSGWGGGIYSTGVLHITDSVITTNTAEYGAGMWDGAVSGSLIERTEFTENDALFDGGGIYTGGATIIDRCLFDTNTAVGDGGALSNGAYTPTIVNSLLISNDAGDNGGGIHVFEGDINVIFCTITENHATTAGGGVYIIPSSGSILISSIVWNNTADGSANDIAGLPTTTYTDSPDAPVHPTNFNADPLFVAGYHIPVGSPCKDTGTAYAPYTYDYDGVTRPQGVAEDVGCYEYTA